MPKPEVVKGEVFMVAPIQGTQSGLLKVGCTGPPARIDPA